MSWYDAAKEVLEGSWFWQIKDGLIPSYNLPEGQEVLVPTFEIAANPTIQLSEIRGRRFYIIDRAQIQAQAAIQAQEDAAIFQAINFAVEYGVEWNPWKKRLPPMRTIKA